MCQTEKTPGASPFTHGAGFHPTGRWRYIGCLYQGGAILDPLTLPSALRITLYWNGLHDHLNIIRVVNN